MDLSPGYYTCMLGEANETWDIARPEIGDRDI